MEREKVKKTLIDALKNVSKDKDFLLAVINHVKKDEDRLKLAEHIKNNPGISYEEILLISLEIYEKQ